MIPLQDYLLPKNTLKEAANLLIFLKRKEEKIEPKGLPVLDKTGNMIGILTVGDILKAVYPSYMYMMNLGDFTWDGMVEDRAKKAGDRMVSEIMTKKVISVNEDAPLMECIDHMIKNKVDTLPVIGKDDKVIGILYVWNIFSAITKVMLEEN